MASVWFWFGKYAHIITYLAIEGSFGLKRRYGDSLRMLGFDVHMLEPLADRQATPEKGKRTLES